MHGMIEAKLRPTFADVNLETEVIWALAEYTLWFSRVLSLLNTRILINLIKTNQWLSLGLYVGTFVVIRLIKLILEQ